MDFTIEPIIRETEFSKIVEQFGSSLASADYNELSHHLSDDIEMTLHKIKSFYGRRAVIEYFADWCSRYGNDAKIEMKWCRTYFQPALYLTVGNRCMVLLFFVNQGLIEKIMFTPRTFSKVGFSVDEYTNTVEFLEINAPKIISTKENHFFCPICGKRSQNLKWREGVIFKQPRYDRWYGLVVHASICDNCNRVVEVYPDKSLDKVLILSIEQREEATKRMNEEERSRYVDGYIGNFRPTIVKGLSKRSNHYGHLGDEIIYSSLSSLIDEGKPELIFSYLNHIKLKNYEEIRCHIASANTGQIGDVSYFFFNENKDENNILPYITSDASEDSAWEVYLMVKATHAMPVFWHGIYHSRRFIFDEADINDISALAYYDLTQLSTSELLLPSVTPLLDGESFKVCCSYWNDWKGLVRESIIITFDSKGNIFLKEEDPFTLFEYKSDIYF